MRFFEEGVFDAAKMEERVLEFWDEEKTFEKSLEKTKSGTPFTFYDGPPFATGLPHYGHLLASTIKDVIPRYQTMRGRFVRRRWGWDCHGLPIEEIVERELGISGKKQIEEIGIKTFNEKCRSMVLQYVNDWRAMVRRIARWVEFDDSYKTMDRTYMESVWWAFKQIHDKELVYEGRKVLLYCPRCETPISNFEVAMDNSYKDIREESVYVKFRVESKSVQKIKDWVVPQNTYLLAWTTTPWTLPGNVALAVGKEVKYAIEKIRLKYPDPKDRVRDGDIVIWAEGARTGIFENAGFPNEGITSEILFWVTGNDLQGLTYKPLFEVPDVKSPQSYKVYLADFVNTEEGTGIVHTAVVYGEEDYQLGLRENLPVVPLLDEKGNFNDKAPYLIRGQYFKDSEETIKDYLDHQKLILKREKRLHSYPHCWRCGTMLFYNAIPAWFVNIQKIKKDLFASNAKEINWYPGHLKHGRYEKSVEAAPDWNISRNRYWGNPIPVWKCESCGKDMVVGSVDELKSKSLANNTYIFLRHGEADHVVDGLVGPADTDRYTSHLTKKGKAQIGEVAQELKNKKIDLIISSPLARAKETSEIVREHIGAPIEYRDELRDIYQGTLDAHPEAEADAYFGNDKMAKFTRAVEGGESRNQVKARVWSALRALEEQYNGKTILIVSHGDALFLLRAALQGLSNEEILAVSYPGVGEIYDFEWSPLPLNDDGNVDLHRPYIDSVALKCDACGGRANKITEIFDSWVEAGSMPFAEYHYPFENKKAFEGRYPGQFVAEYIAQTRAWFYVMHVIGRILFGRAPFENVVTTGTILAEDGSKMSKSKKNFPDPSLVIDKYGADSLRFYLMNSIVMQADNLNFSQRDLETTHRKVTMIFYNVYNYFATYAREAKWRADGKNAASGNALDRWIEARTKELVCDATKHLDSYDTVWATRAIESYIDDLSTWYLRRSRGRADAGFFAAFYRTLIALSQVVAPFMPHLAEAVYLNLTGEFGDADAAESVHLTDWPAAEALTKEEAAMLEMMAAAREAASAGQAIRKQKNIPVRQPLPALRVIFRDKSKSLPPEFSAILLSELNIKAEDPNLEDENDTASFEGGERIERVLISTALTEELELEGLARRVERFVQELRKKQGFKVGEAATLRYATADEKLKRALELFDKKKTYILKIEETVNLEGETCEAGGVAVTFALVRG